MPDPRRAHACVAPLLLSCKGALRHDPCFLFKAAVTAQRFLLDPTAPA
jgi:hypothetical protein